MPPPVRVVIDTDPGIDDVVALALAVRSPELDVVAVTTSYGNTTLENTTRNARTLLGLAGRADIPVLPGSSQPLVRKLVTAPERHGPSGVGYAAVPPAPPVEPDPTVLLSVLSDTSDPITLITLGPLTNLAHALSADGPLVRHRVAAHMGVFGNLHKRANAERWADFNAWCDPEAADHVLRGELGSVLVGLDVTRRMVLTADEVARFASSNSRFVAWLGDALRFYVEFHRGWQRLDGCFVHDILPIGALISPQILRLAQDRLIIDLQDGENRGRTREHPHGIFRQVALGVETAKMKLMLQRVTQEA